MTVRSTVMWSAVRNWATRLGSVAIFFIMARILSKHELGMVSATLAILAFVEMFAENGLGDAVVKSNVLTTGGLKAALLVNATAGTLLAALLMTFSPSIEHWFSTPGLAPLVSVAAFGLILNGLGYIPQSLLRRDLRYKELATRSLIATSCSGLIGIALAYLEYGAWAMIAQYLSFAIISLGLVWLRMPLQLATPVDLSGLGRLLRFGGAVLVGRVLYYFTSRVIEIVILYRFGAVQLSIYIMGSRIFFVVTQMLTAVIVDVSFSSFARKLEDRARLASSLVQAMQVASLVTVPVFLGMSAIAPELTAVAFGENGNGAAPFLFVISLLGISQVPYHFFATVLNLLGRPGLSSTLTGVQAAATLLVLVPDWGFQPITLVAISSSLSLIVAPALAVACWRTGAYSIRAMLISNMPAYLAGALMWGSVLFLRPVVAPHVTSPLLLGTVLSFVGALIYFGLLMLIAPAALPSLLRNRLRQVA